MPSPALHRALPAKRQPIPPSIKNGPSQGEIFPAGGGGIRGLGWWVRPIRVPGFPSSQVSRARSMAPLSWRHHTLLQALLHRGPLSERDFHAVFAGVSGKNPGTPYALLPSRRLSRSILSTRHGPTSARRNASLQLPCRAYLYSLYSHAGGGACKHKQLQAAAA